MHPEGGLVEQVALVPRARARHAVELSRARLLAVEINQRLAAQHVEEDGTERPYVGGRRVAGLLERVALGVARRQRLRGRVLQRATRLHSGGGEPALRGWGACTQGTESLHAWL